MSGCTAAFFDSSSSLLATKVEDSPSTVWVWDLSATELRAVLLFSSDVTSFRWHSTIPELLLVTCQGGDHNGVIFIWDPLSSGPKSLDCAEQFPGGTIAAKWQASWVDSADDVGMVLVGDNDRYLLVSLADPEVSPHPWGGLHQSGSAAGASEDRLQDRTAEFLNSIDDDASCEIEDTFHFKKTPGSQI